MKRSKKKRNPCSKTACLRQKGKKIGAVKRRKNPGLPRIVVATGNPRSGAMSKKRKSRKGGYKRRNPGRKHHRRHHRRRNPAGGVGKIFLYVAAGLASGALAFGLPEIMSLSGVKAYAPAALLVGGGAFLAKKNPMLGLAVAAGGAAGAGAPLLASKMVTPAAPATSAIIGALGPRLNVPRMAAIIQGIGNPVYEPRADMLMRGV